MKKALSLILFIVLVFVLSIATFAEDLDIIASGYCGGEGDGTNLEWKLDSEGTLTISGEGEMKDFDYIFSGNKAPWGEYINELKKLVLKEGVTCVGDYSFQDCEFFTDTLIIPESVINIGKSAFKRCKGFTGSLIIPNNVKIIEADAFSNCSGFNGDLLIGDNVDTIGTRAFYNCRGFTGNLLMGNSIITIGDRAFYYCDGFTGKIVLSDKLKTIKGHAFYHCDGFIGKLMMPASLTDIEENAFNYCGIDEFYFNGNAPKIQLGISGESFDLDDTIYYPEGNDTWGIVDGKWNGYTAVPWEVPFKTGDINQDRKIDVKDVYPARLVAAKLVVPTEEELSLGDVDGDGKITAIDANLIRKFAAGIIDNFPVEV